MVHEYEVAMLKLLKKHKSVSMQHLQEGLSLGKDSVMWAAENLDRAGLVKVEKEGTTEVSVTKEGMKYLNGFPEENLVHEIQKKGGSIPIEKETDNIGIIWAKRNGWVLIDHGNVALTGKGKEIVRTKKGYSQRELLGKASNGEIAPNTIRENKNIIDILKGRNLLEVRDKELIKAVTLTEKGEKAQLDESKGIGALTREDIANRTWEKEGLRQYDIHSNAEEAIPARLHPMHEFINVVRNAWLNMGFTEVEGPMVESSFWNFDALFSPQDHPTREMQDTFFLSNPSRIEVNNKQLVGRVRAMHVKGWKGKWSEEVAGEPVLRTQTTSVSVRHIHKFANVGESLYPVKLFSIGKVFRNENIDPTHLAELHQVDGIIMGTNLTLSNLIATLRQFYLLIGMDDIIIKPSYFPFVEPGLEINYFDRKKNALIELGGGGIIRKEITKAMGTNKTVLAWGVGLERLMFNTLNIQSLIELYKNDIGWLRKRRELKI